MKFKFAFESLLKHRRNLEEMARKQFLEAQAQVDECLAELKSFYDQQDRTRHEIQKMTADGGRNTSELQSLDEYIDGLELKIERQRQEARRLIEISEEKRDLLVEAARDYKVLEKLREKRRQEFLKVKMKLEDKSMQDLVTMRFKRSRHDGGI